MMVYQTIKGWTVQQRKQRCQACLMEHVRDNNSTPHYGSGTHWAYKFACRRRRVGRGTCRGRSANQLSGSRALRLIMRVVKHTRYCCKYRTERKHNNKSWINSHGVSWWLGLQMMHEDYRESRWVAGSIHWVTQQPWFGNNNLLTVIIAELSLGSVVEGTGTGCKWTKQKQGARGRWDATQDSCACGIRKERRKLTASVGSAVTAGVGSGCKESNRTK